MVPVTFTGIFQFLESSVAELEPFGAELFRLETESIFLVGFDFYLLITKICCFLDLFLPKIATTKKAEYIFAVLI